MDNPSLVFLGSATFALPALRCLLAAGFNITAVITRPDRPSGRGKKLAPTAVKKEALSRKLDVHQPRNKGELLETLQELKPQLAVNVAYGMILPDAVLELPPLGCLNLHPSLLPSYRGAAPIQRALMAGETVTGITVMFMTSRLDAGDIVLQEKVSIGSDEDFGTLHDRLAEQGGALLSRAVGLHFQGKASRTPQDEKLATFAPPLTPDTEKIDWSEPAATIFNLVRALSPSPGAYTFFRGLRLKIRQAGLPAKQSADMAFPGKEEQTPGTVSEIGTDHLAVQCGSGIIHLREVQPESKRRMEARSFALGQRLEVGEQFG